MTARMLQIQSLVVLNDSPKHRPADKVRADRMLESRVNGPSIDKVREPKLAEPRQALKLGRVYYFDSQG
jgi:hypothetical protein